MKCVELSSVWRFGDSPGRHARPGGRIVLLGMLSSAGVGRGWPPSMLRRRSRAGIPSDEHFAAFTPYLNGDYVSAAKLFESAPRIKSTEGVWIDSIPYHAMIGECKYQMGDLAGALEQYSAALQVFLRYPDWLLFLEYCEDR